MCFAVYHTECMCLNELIAHKLSYVSVVSPNVRIPLKYGVALHELRIRVDRKPQGIWANVYDAVNCIPISEYAEFLHRAVWFRVMFVEFDEQSSCLQLIRRAGETEATYHDGIVRKVEDRNECLCFDFRGNLSSYSFPCDGKYISIDVERGIVIRSIQLRVVEQEKLLFSMHWDQLTDVWRSATFEGDRVTLKTFATTPLTPRGFLPMNDETGSHARVVERGEITSVSSTKATLVERTLRLAQEVEDHDFSLSRFYALALCFVGFLPFHCIALVYDIFVARTILCIVFTAVVHVFAVLWFAYFVVLPTFVLSLLTVKPLPQYIPEYVHKLLILQETNSIQFLECF